MSSFLRRLAILEFLRSSSQAKTTEEINHHLLNSGYIDETLPSKTLLRQTQRDMIYFYGAPVAAQANLEEQNAENDFGIICSRGEGKSLLWSLDPYSTLKFDFEKMPQYMAVAFAMTKKHLSNLLPRNTLSELERFFNQAEARLNNTKKNIGPQSYHRLKDSIEFYQRGQRLKPAEYSIEHLDTIYRAILQKKQIRIIYRSKDYLLHPLGVAILLPKLYLVAIKDEDKDSSPPSYRHFLVHKIDRIFLESKKSTALPDFSLKKYLEQGHMDILIDPKDTREYQLELELIPKQQQSQLVNDLKTSPLSHDQTITQITEQRYLMKASVHRTIQLQNWLLNLGPEARVLGPKVIKTDVIKTLKAMLDHYENSST